MAKTRQINIRLEEKALNELRDLSEVTGDSSSNIIRDLISKAYKRLTPAMLATLEKNRAEERSVRAKVIG